MASPPPHSRSQPAPATQLDFSQAMSDFKVMFPDMDAEVIEAVLRSNNGAVDVTIDHLLTMSADTEAQKVTNDPGRGTESDCSWFGGGGGGDRAASRHHPEDSFLPPSYSQATRGDGGQPVKGDEDLINLGDGGGSNNRFFGPSSSGEPLEEEPSTADLLSHLDLDALGAASNHPKQSLAYSNAERQEAEDRAAASSSSSSIVPTQQQLQEIYEENLRLREAAATKNESGGGGGRSQFLEDERIALMLQNEEFMAELRRDHEFMSSLEMDGQTPPSTATTTTPRSAAAAASASVPKVPKAMDEAVFREKLKNMGKTSKRKFSQMASMFSRRKGVVAKQLLGHAPAPSKDNLLLNAEPLVNEYSDEEDAVSTKTPTKGKYKSLS